MNRKKEIKEELQEIAPFLSEIEKKEVFKVPHNYFEQLPDEIMAQLKTKQNTQRKIAGLPWWNQFVEIILPFFQARIVMAMASIALIVASFFYLNQNDVENNISSMQYLAYIEENMDDFEEEMIFELSQNMEIGMDILLDIKIENQDLDTYLDDVIEDLDDSTLEELL